MADKKERIDKYYKLAKKKGYRARSAFKLLELNQKYHFLDNATIAIDLCAAPGGWLQILAEKMDPRKSKIIGVDLEPIKALSDCETFIADITTVECRRRLTELLEGRKADIVVHDGAPNFGTSGGAEYFVQNDLVLHAYKLASEFLVKDGTFLTKVFRSENFSIILNLLGILFENVEVTKPLSSRAISAEIYVVCTKFKDPNLIDSAIFETSKQFLNVQPLEFCDEYKEICLSEFLKSKNDQLLTASGSIKVDFKSDRIKNEHIEMFKDLKLLGKIEIKQLLKLKKNLCKDIALGKITISAAVDSNDCEMFQILLNYIKPLDGERSSTVSKKMKSERLLKEKLEKLIPSMIVKEEQAQIEKEKKQEKESKEMSKLHHFYQDKIFDVEKFKTKFEEDKKNEDDELPNIEDEIIEPSSCSSDMNMTPYEMKCALMLKEKGEDFEEDAIDRHIVDSDDIQLPGEQRPIKMKTPKMVKKKTELLNRKKARALRRANKLVGNLHIENEKEEAIIYKKVFKSEFKKQGNKRRLVFANSRGGPAYISRGKGKVLRLDRRMKNDLYLQKKRKKFKSGKK